MIKLIYEIENYIPFNEQEVSNKEMILKLLKKDENRGVKWIDIEDIQKNESSEKWMIDRVYTKLCKKVGNLYV